MIRNINPKSRRLFIKEVLETYDKELFPIKLDSDGTFDSTHTEWAYYGFLIGLGYAWDILEYETTKTEEAQEIIEEVWCDVVN